MRAGQLVPERESQRGGPQWPAVPKGHCIGWFSPCTVAEIVLTSVSVSPLFYKEKSIFSINTVRGRYSEGRY